MEVAREFWRLLRTDTNGVVEWNSALARMIDDHTAKEVEAERARAVAEMNVWKKSAVFGRDMALQMEKYGIAQAFNFVVGVYDRAIKIIKAD